MQHFAPQTQPAQETTYSLRSRQYRKPARRRLDDEDEASSPPSDAQLDAQSDSSDHPSDSEQAAQLRVAGLLPRDAAEIPPKPFPHAPARPPARERLTSAKIRECLAELDPPLFAVDATSKGGPVGGTGPTPELRQRHLGVLTTVLHRCLLEHDYLRAGRAWGLILRSQIAGAPIDPRNHRRWGIGAEILLNRGGPSDTGTNPASTPSETELPYSETGFERAKAYYERLIVQFPNRKNAARAVDNLTFYPAMFSLWIYDASERSKRAKRRLQEDGDAEDLPVDDILPQAAAIVAEELAQARQIADRMDQLLTSPPFDKFAPLLHLRGNVGLWLSDLVLQTGKEQLGESKIWEDESMEEDRETETHPEQLRRLAESQRELRQANDSFNRAQTYGDQIISEITSTEARLEEISSRIAHLQGT
ncbi:hypothetical protein M011DRAFT_93225 [Sporormia fimetaria CBS 119925]|uniref:Uncharacterized protein n=1 Tax=Sporormia fimetaria CBS 119925 TaxID=1340428 RepID=A0A6A6V9H3_9PLEO|nr:hypothetical protein M011DRAFT_93225 [Sporormia fimetaria CBS 119925]